MNSVSESKNWRAQVSDATDQYTMRSCRYLIRFLGKNAMPKGETVESIGELVEVHRQALHVMKQRTGKGALVLELGMLAKTYPVPFASSDAKLDDAALFL